MRPALAYAALLALMAPAGGPAAAGGSMPALSGGFSGTRYDPTAEYRRGMLALQDDRDRDAADAFTHVVEAQPNDADAWRMLGEARSGAGDLKAAEHAYARSMALDPSAIEARRDFAVTLAKLDQNVRAAAQLAALRTRAAACAETCQQAPALDAAIAAVQAALAPAAPPSSAVR